MLNCEDLLHEWNDEVLLVTGPPLGPEGSLLERARTRGVPVRIVDSLRREIHPNRDLASYRDVRAVLEEFRPEVVHTHSAKAGIVGRLAASRVKVPAIVHTVHGAPFYPEQNVWEQRLSRWAEWHAARRTDAFISVADAMTDLFVKYRIAPREKFTTIYSGMEVEPFLQAEKERQPVREEFGFADDEIVIGKIARLFPLKGHEFILKSATDLVREVPQVRFLFVGDGILRESLERQARAAGLSDHIRFAGLVPPERIPALIAGMDLLVHTSLREGLARALPQALLVGRPVVSYDIDGAREVVLHERTGLLVPPRQINALTEALARMAADAGLRARCGAAGRELCQERFRHEQMTADIRKVYQRVLSERAPAIEVAK